MNTQNKRRCQIWIPPELVTILKTAEKRWPYRKRVEFVREALADFADKHNINWQEATA
jgi:hypothetical protein